MINKNRTLVVSTILRKPRYYLVLYHFQNKNNSTHLTYTVPMFKEHLTSGLSEIEKIQQKSEFNSKVLNQHFFMG